MTYSKRRAIFFTCVASLAGVLGWLLIVYDKSASLPLAIFYALLVVNTYPSVELFSSLVPRNDGKHALADSMLAALYLFLAATIGNPQQFVLCATVLFMVAAGKYTLMLYEIPHEELVHRKVRIDLLGALLCSAVLAAMIFGWEKQATWTLAVVFAFANVYVLLLRPLYRV